MKKKILLLDQADFIGGAELFNLDLINSLDAEKFEIHLLFSGNPVYRTKIKQQVKEFVYPLPRLKSGFFRYWHLLKSAWLVRKIVQKENIDLIQSNTIRMHIVAALAKKLFRFKIPLVWFVHDFTFPQNVLQKMIVFPDLILTCSEAVKKDLLQKTSSHFSAKMKVVYNGVKIRNKKQRDNQMQILQNLLKTGTTRDLNKKHKIGIVGRLDPWKGQDIFLKASRKIWIETNRVEFYIIGVASEYDQSTLEFAEQLKKMTREFSLEKAVKFLGYVENLEKEMSKLDIVVHASKKPEPFGRVIIEAMNLGKVVIASELGGTMEIIENGIDGFLIPPDNAKILAEKILQILNNESQKLQIAKNANAKVAEKFDLRKQVKKIENHWEKLTGSK